MSMALFIAGIIAAIIGAILVVVGKIPPAYQPSMTVTSGVGGSGSRLDWAVDRRTNSAGPRGTTVAVAPVSIERPAPTVTSMTGAQWVLRNGSRENATERAADEPAGTIFFGHALNDMRWYDHRPSTTIQGDPQVGRPGHKDRDKGESQFERDSLKITQAEATVLQSFRPDYPWQGNKTKQFEQIGNAVPPLLAARIIAAITGAKVPV
jgi:DNA (cytosine-5)-methyltransferase 1